MTGNAIRAGALALVAMLQAASALAAERVHFTAGETRRILQHGPWPARWSPDPSNRVSGMPAAIAFGAQLFFDAQLSGDAALSCASCHVPARSFSDGRKLGLGREEVERNTPALLNVRYQRWFGWDGGNDNLWAQSLRPLVDAREFGASEAGIAARVRADARLDCGYRRAFKEAAASADDETVFVNVGKALAAYQETLVSGRTPFDDFRDALARGDARGVARYPLAARRGLRTFVGKGNCSVCHFGPNFTNGEFHEIGISVLGPRGKIDWGRYQGIKMLQSSRFNLEGAFSDDRTRSTAVSTRHVALGAQAFEQFRVPSLRNVARTAPYMHNGHFATLQDVVGHYSRFDPASLHQVHMNDDQGVPLVVPPDMLLKPLDLSAQEIDDLVAFLGSLTEKSPRRAATRPPPPVSCSR